MKSRIRRFFWRILGIEQQHILGFVDHVFLKEDRHSFIGTKSYDNHALVYRWSDAPIIIGKYCSISYGVRFIVDDGTHQYNKITAYPFKENQISSRKGIMIGNDVWIGMNAIILNGTKIGNGVTIGAGAVVTGDIPDYSVVGGVPAHIIKEKCTKEEASAMNEIAWWNWSEGDIIKALPDFQLDYAHFIDKYKSSR